MADLGGSVGGQGGLPPVSFTFGRYSSIPLLGSINGYRDIDSSKLDPNLKGSLTFEWGDQSPDSGSLILAQQNLIFGCFPFFSELFITERRRRHKLAVAAVAAGKTFERF